MLRKINEPGGLNTNMTGFQTAQTYIDSWDFSVLTFCDTSDYPVGNRPHDLVISLG